MKRSFVSLASLLFLGCGPAVALQAPKPTPLAVKFCAEFACVNTKLIVRVVLPSVILAVPLQSASSV